MKRTASVVAFWVYRFQEFVTDVLEISELVKESRDKSSPPALLSLTLTMPVRMPPLHLDLLPCLLVCSVHQIKVGFTHSRASTSTLPCSFFWSGAASLQHGAHASVWGDVS